MRERRDRRTAYSYNINYKNVKKGELNHNYLFNLTPNISDMEIINYSTFFDLKINLCGTNITTYDNNKYNSYTIDNEQLKSKVQCIKNVTNNLISKEFCVDPVEIFKNFNLNLRNYRKHILILLSYVQNNGITKIPNHFCNSVMLTPPQSANKRKSQTS